MASDPSSLRVRQFRVPALANSESFQSYCIWDLESREAIFVDPHFSAIQEYVDHVLSLQLKPRLLVDTALHYSHPSGARALNRQFGVPVAMSERTRSEWVDRKVSDGDLISIGSFKFQISMTPGIAEDAICLHGSGIALTGETLWVGTSGALGLPGSDAGLLFESLNALRSRLRESDLIFSGYDAMELSFSVWGVELERNPDLRAKSSGELKELKSRSSVHLSEDFLSFARFNSSRSVMDSNFRKTESLFRFEGLEKESQAYASISSEKLSHQLSSRKKAALLDVRERAEFEISHIPGALSMPITEVALRLSELRRFARVYVYDQLGRRSALIAATLSYIGFNDVVVLTGGFQAWQNAGLPVEKKAPGP